MPSWRVVDLDRDEPRKRRVVDPMEIVAVVVLALVAVGVAPRFLGASAPAASTPAPTQAPVVTSLRADLALASRRLGAGACGPFDAAIPQSTFAEAARATPRIDAAVSLAADPWWYWCVAGARVYEDGIEVVGKLVPQGDPPNGQRSRPALRAASLSGQIEGFGALGPGEIARTPDGYSLLRLRAVSDNGRRGQFRAAAERTSTVTLRLASLAGPWTFPAQPLASGPVGTKAEAQGVSFQVRDLTLLPAGFAMTTSFTQDPPDPAVVTIEWDVQDDRGTAYRPQTDRPAGLTATAVAFGPSPPRGATSLSVSIQRLYLAPLREFAVTLPLVP